MSYVASTIAEPSSSAGSPRPPRLRRWRSGRVPPLVALLLLVCAAPLLGQADGELPSVFRQAFETLAMWGVVSLILFLAALFASGRLLGLDISPMDAVASVLFGVVIAFVPVAVISVSLRESLGDQLGPLLLQAIGLLALWQAVKVVFQTDYVRAAASILLASILSLSLTATLLIALY